MKTSILCLSSFLFLLGVASVSIVPAVSHPVGVKNPLPLLQSQFIKITNSPVNINTHGELPWLIYAYIY